MRPLGFLSSPPQSAPIGSLLGVLYTWLLEVGGQSRFARVVLDEALRRTPADPVLRQVQASLSGPWPTATGALVDASAT